MNAFQVLKSGASFRRKNHEKAKGMFAGKSINEEEENGEEIKHDRQKKRKLSSDIVEIKQIQDLKSQIEENNNLEEADRKKLKLRLLEKEKQKINEMRKLHKIKVEGDKVPEMKLSYKDMNNKGLIGDYMFENLDKVGFAQPTSIQMQAIPTFLKRRDLFAIAPTGSGKTLSYLLPLITLLGDSSKEGIRGIIVAPTRELAQQIYNQFLLFNENNPGKIVGKMLTKATMPSSENDVAQFSTFDLLIATPLRLVHLVETNKIKLDTVKYLVLDEADKLFELGFVEQLDEIISHCTHKNIMKAMFSATLLPAIESLARSIMKDPVKISVGIKNTAVSNVKQELRFCGNEDGKLVGIKQLIQEGIKPPVILFVQSKERAKELFEELKHDKLKVDAIHSDKSQSERDQVIAKFRKGEIWILICTDLLGRGVDFAAVNMVINYDFPQSIVSYIHRVGRTGRAGREGRAVTFFTEEDGDMLRSVAHVIKNSGGDVPQWMLELKKTSRRTKKSIEKHPVKREHISRSVRACKDNFRKSTGKGKKSSENGDKPTTKTVQKSQSKKKQDPQMSESDEE